MDMTFWHKWKNYQTYYLWQQTVFYISICIKVVTFETKLYLCLIFKINIFADLPMLFSLVQVMLVVFMIKSMLVFKQKYVQFVI